MVATSPPTPNATVPSTPGICHGEDGCHEDELLTLDADILELRRDVVTAMAVLCVAGALLNAVGLMLLFLSFSFKSGCLWLEVVGVSDLIKCLAVLPFEVYGLAHVETIDVPVGACLILALADTWLAFVTLLALLGAALYVTCRCHLPAMADLRRKHWTRCVGVLLLAGLGLGVLDTLGKPTGLTTYLHPHNPSKSSSQRLTCVLRESRSLELRQTIGDVVIGARLLLSFFLLLGLVAAVLAFCLRRRRDRRDQARRRSTAATVRASPSRRSRRQRLVEYGRLIDAVDVVVDSAAPLLEPGSSKDRISWIDGTLRQDKELLEAVLDCYFFGPRDSLLPPPRPHPASSPSLLAPPGNKIQGGSQSQPPRQVSSREVKKPKKRPVKTGDVNRPVNTGDVNRPVKTGDVNRPVNTGDVNRPVNTGDVNRHVNTGDVNRPVNTGDVNRSVNTGDLNRPVNTGDLNRPVNTGDVNRPVNTGETRQPVNTEDRERPVFTVEVRRPVDDTDSRATVGIDEASRRESSVDAKLSTSGKRSPPVHHDNDGDRSATSSLGQWRPADVSQAQQPSRPSSQAMVVRVQSPSLPPPHRQDRNTSAADDPAAQGMSSVGGRDKAGPGQASRPQTGTSNPPPNTKGPGGERADCSVKVRVTPSVSFEKQRGGPGGRGFGLDKRSSLGLQLTTSRSLRSAGVNSQLAFSADRHDFRTLTSLDVDVHAALAYLHVPEERYLDLRKEMIYQRAINRLQRTGFVSVSSIAVDGRSRSMASTLRGVGESCDYTMSNVHLAGYVKGEKPVEASILIMLLVAAVIVLAATVPHCIYYFAVESPGPKYELSDILSAYLWIEVTYLPVTIKPLFYLCFCSKFRYRCLKLLCCGFTGCGAGACGKCCPCRCRHDDCRDCCRRLCRCRRRARERRMAPVGRVNTATWSRHSV